MSQAVQLTLVPQSAPRAGLRPFVTTYFGRRAKPSEWSHKGHSASLRGAVLAATRQVLDGRAHTALIVGPEGFSEVVVRRTPQGLRVEGWPWRDSQ
jgi:hypothetical protein